MQCFSFGSRKVSYTLLLRFCQNFLRVLPHKKRVSLGSRQVCCLLVFILLYSVIFCFACFASPTSGLSSAFPFASPQLYTLLVFFVLFSSLCVLCSTNSGLCSDLSPAPLEFARFIFCFVLFSFKFVFCVLSLTNLIFLRFPYNWFITFVTFVTFVAFGQYVRRVLFYTVYSGVNSSSPVDFE